VSIRTSTYTPARTRSHTATGSPVTRLYRAAGASNRTIWATQAILAVVFLFAGVSKLVMSAESLTEGSDFPVEFVRFIGVCETLGAVGLVLPGLLRIRTGLTPLAAGGLVVIMVGAVMITAADSGVLPALFPFVVGAACAFVATSRARQSRSHRAPGFAG
jgi:uncharacterized membrane protein YphA (DoxX/SURF4 family)